ITRLEAIVRDLDRDDLDLDGALALFEEGITHLRVASSALTTAEARVQQLVEAADGTFSLAEFGS
ncbi:MAG: exodeoxyribonuclease VII small subunit, partial [Phycisphaerae bacterium]|nr:exodeoxyribonuclease VII small subunit [Gemmatimonadaceae bacterium]